MQQISILLSWR